MSMDDLLRWRHDLHRIPELGFQERETSAYVRSVLEQLGLDVVSRAETGLVAEIAGNGRGPVIAVRADMDGLPLQEESGEAFASRHDGVMHACGHDVHMTAVLGMAARLAAEPDFPGTVRLLFQPSEEGNRSGAKALMDDGALADVDGIIGLHVWAPVPVGTVVMRAGAFMANTDGFEITVHGRGGHGSEPETAKDAVLIGSQIVVNLQTIVSRHVSPLDSCVVSVGTFDAGSASNILAETAHLTGTVRTFSGSVQDQVERDIAKMANHTAALHGATVDVVYHRGVPAVINHPAVIQSWRQVLTGMVTVQESGPYMGGEDFAYYLRAVPGAFIFLGGRPDGEQFPHHSPHFRVSDACLPIGVEVLERGARTLSTHPEVLRQA